jgi:hypothetical protein
MMKNTNYGPFMQEYFSPTFSYFFLPKDKISFLASCHYRMLIYVVPLRWKFYIHIHNKDIKKSM